MSAPLRQTQRYLIEKFQSIGFKPKSKYGQNFLIDWNLLNVLFRSAEVQKEDVVLEVGTGTGSLTQLLAQAAFHVITVEIDAQLYQLAQENLNAYDNITLLHQDALKNKNQLDPGLLQQVEFQLARSPQGRFLLVANLPYNVATPVISNLLGLKRPPERMTVTIQKELAERVVASPGTKDYGSLSIWVQCQARPKILRTMPPSVFWPRPEVSSAILQVEFDPQLRCRIDDLDFFHQFVRQVFLHRRKFLRSVLQSQFRKQMPKSRVDEIMSELGLPPQTRAEELSVEEFITLARRFSQEVKS